MRGLTFGKFGRMGAIGRATSWPGNSAPVGLPTISGTATEGETITADAGGVTDADGLGTFSYQWLRSGAQISGATGTTYVLTGDDVGETISVRVSYTDGMGKPERVTSLTTSAVVGLSTIYESDVYESGVYA